MWKKTSIHSTGRGACATQNANCYITSNENDTTTITAVTTYFCSTFDGSNVLAHAQCPVVGYKCRSSEHATAAETKKIPAHSTSRYECTRPRIVKVLNFFLLKLKFKPHIAIPIVYNILKISIPANLLLAEIYTAMYLISPTRSHL